MLLLNKVAIHLGKDIVIFRRLLHGFGVARVAPELTGKPVSAAFQRAGSVNGHH